jgi:glycosyltransferase involved in cell wall biosynthesis
LQESVKSVLSQDYPDFELIIVNDGSTDNSQEVAEAFAINDPRIKVYYQNNAGLSTARNLGLKFSSGEIVHFLDADDLVFPTSYSLICKKFEFYASADLIVCGYSYFNENQFFHTNCFDEAVISTIDILISNIAPPVSFFIKREIIAKIGCFDNHLKSCEDWDFWIRAGKLDAKIYSIPEVLVAYRYVPFSMSRNPRVMYSSLTEVSRRAGLKDLRLSEDSKLNRDYDLDFLMIQKKHLLTVLGVMIQQGNVLEASEWYMQEKSKWNLTLVPKDWLWLSSYLSWRYLLTKKDVEYLLDNVRPSLNEFFIRIGYDSLVSNRYARSVMAPQLKKLNHIRFGKYIGAILNCFHIY